MDKQLQEKLKKIKYVYSDIDGTISDDRCNVSLQTIQTIQELMQRGYKFGLVSGRTKYMAKVYIEALKPNLPYVGCNGGWVVNQSQQTLKSFHEINPEFVRIFLPILINEGYSFFVFSSECIYYYFGKDKAGREDLKSRFLMFDNTRASVLELPTNFDKPALHLLVCKGWDRFYIPEEFKLLAQKYGVNLFQGMHKCIEANDPRDDKAAGIMFALGSEASLDEVLVFGDSYNDIPMLKRAGISVAMLNANDEIKQYATTVSEFDNNHNGVSEFLRKYLLNH